MALLAVEKLLYRNLKQILFKSLFDFHLCCYYDHLQSVVTRADWAESIYYLLSQSI